MSRVSVVIPARDAAAHVGRALESLWAQTRAPDQCIVVVGASRDKTLEIVQGDSRLDVVLQEGDGLARARNQGISRVTGDVVAFLDADDEWLPDKTRRQLEVLEQDPEAMAVIGLMERVDPEGTSVGGVDPALTPSGLMVRVEVFGRIGGFDSRFRIACDTEWLMRARDACVGPTMIDEVVMRKHLRPTSLSRDLPTYQAEMLTVVREMAARRAEAAHP